MFTFEVDFTDTSAFTAETRNIIVQASLAGLQDVAPMVLIQQPNPYMVDGAVSWLSTDVRVFQLRKNQKVNSSSSVTLGDVNADANVPFTYIQALLNEMRSFGNNSAPPFENISQNEQASQLELSRTVNGERVLNFAVAKVRYRANAVDANGVRVFFRGFNVMVSDLRYTTNPGSNVQNYRRTGDGSTPLLGINSFFSGAGNQVISIPYFAQARIDTGSQSMTTQQDTANVQNLVHAGSQEALQYFGCWLDFNQMEPQFPAQVPSGSDGPFTGRLPIVQFVRGIHQCLVAEVRFQPGATDPIPNGATPSTSDRLAQRNLAIVESDNPGNADTHVVQHTLLLKPSTLPGARAFAVATNPGDPESLYDELVIRWNDIPAETKASLYFPDWSADEIIALAGSLRRGKAALTKIDTNTIGCPVRDITYIPLPGRIERPVPGLLTLQMPLTVRDGQEFRLDVQQHSGPTFRRLVRNPSPVPEAVVVTGRQEVSVSERKVLGAFRMTVAVQTGERLLPKAVRNIAVLKYIHQAIPAGDSWRPVFERYIAQLGDKVKGLGVDPGLIPPSADDPGLPAPTKHCVTGKVCEVIFDCFGSLEGFVLETCEGRHRFRSSEPAIADLVLRACKDRLLISVCADRAGGRIQEIVVRSGDCR
jgi:hypothetical protein